MVLQNATSAATLSERLAQYIHKTSIKDLDHALRQHVKQILIYHVGLALRAVRTEERLRTTTGRVYVQEGQSSVTHRSRRATSWNGRRQAFSRETR